MCVRPTRRNIIKIHEAIYMLQLEDLLESVLKFTRKILLQRRKLELHGFFTFILYYYINNATWTLEIKKFAIIVTQSIIEMAERLDIRTLEVDKRSIRDEIVLGGVGRGGVPDVHNDLIK